MATKYCTTCKEELSFECFYRDRTPINTISYRSKCKKCCKEQQLKRKIHKPNDSIISKMCSICNENKDISNFYKSYRHKDGYFKWCNVCHEIKVKNKGNNKKIKRTPEYMREYNINKMYKIEQLLKFQLRRNLRTYLRKNIKCSKENKTQEYLGCTIEFLKKWFEFNFDSNMNWDNRGTYWHIDHIKPCSSFDLTNQEEIYKCYNWTNLRPLEKIENIMKSNNIDNNLIKTFETKSKEFLNNINHKYENNLYILLPEVKALTLNYSEEPGELTGNP
jgi:hypothetical protein